MDLTREEQETIIRTNALHKTCEVVTADPLIMRRMEKQGYKPDERRNPAGYVSYTIPFSRVRILRTEKRKPSEKTLAALAKTQFKSKNPDLNRAPGD
jgi:hypothetical protein